MQITLCCIQNQRSPVRFFQPFFPNFWYYRKAHIFLIIHLKFHNWNLSRMEDINENVPKHNEILPSKPKVHLLLTVSYSRSEYFLRNDLLDPTIATWWRPHECWWRQKRIVNMWQKVGPLVSIHSVRYSLPNPNCFSDMAWPCIALLTKNFGILPVDNMVVLHCMVSDSWSR